MEAGRQLGGERSVAVAGDVVGSLIVTGDGNTFNLQLGAEHGALLERMRAPEPPRARLRARPVRSVRPPFANTVNRVDEAQAVIRALAAGEPVNLTGERGVGKTYVLLRALGGDDPILIGDLVYVYAPGPLEDVLQGVFESWYESEAAVKVVGASLRHDLAAVGGVIALDAVALEREAAQQVAMALPGCRIVVCSRQRVLWDGRAVPVHGLETKSALSVVEQELGRALRRSERSAAARVCEALGGHPLRIREAIGTGRPLDELAASLSQAEPAARVGAAKLEAAGENGRRLLAALAVFGEASLGQEHLQAIAAVPDFEAVLAGALARRDVYAHSPRYSLGESVAAVAGRLESEGAGDRALAHFTAWSATRRGEPSAIVAEGEGLLALLRWAAGAGRARPAVALGRSVESAFALSRRFGAWEEVLEIVLGAARECGDRSAEAWALHQLGTRAVCLSQWEAGHALLSHAIAVRRELGEDAGADLSAANRALAVRSRWWLSWMRGHSALLLALVVVLCGAVAVAVAVAGAGSPPTSHQAALIATGSRGVAGGRSVSSTAKRSPRTKPSGPAATATRPATSGCAGGCTTTRPASGTSATPSTAGKGGPTYTLAVSSSSAGTVTSSDGTIDCGSTCSAHVRAGTTMRLTAKPSTGYTFTGWSGACRGTAATCTVTMGSDQTVTPSFTATDYRLTVSVDGSGQVIDGSGKIHCYPISTALSSVPSREPPVCSADFQAGASVALSAESSQSSAFAAWGAGCSGSDPSCTVTMSADMKVSATFIATSSSSSSAP